jgi:hypothetical protein
MMCVPSVRAKKLASSPVMNSSITASAPPKRPAKMSSTAATASAISMATVTPLPAARPSALMTTGAPKRSRAARASSRDDTRT